MKFEGIGFNSNTVESFKTLNEWLNYCQDNPHWFAGDENREEKLTQLWLLHHPEKTKEDEPVRENGTDIEPEH